MTATQPKLHEYRDEEEDLGPSLAVPPLYVLRTGCRCPECGKANYVYTLGCTAFHDAEEGSMVEAFHFLRLIRSVPEAVTELLKEKCPHYFLDQEHRSERRYLMNHCRCEARLDDDLLHGDVGAPFWPDTADGFGYIKLFRLPIAEAILIECSYAIDGGDYLNVAQAEVW
jgi:hypothetical protein